MSPAGECAMGPGAHGQRRTRAPGARRCQAAGPPGEHVMARDGTRPATSRPRPPSP
jgi:hypothetical protein